MSEAATGAGWGRLTSFGRLQRPIACRLARACRRSLFGLSILVATAGSGFAQDLPTTQLHDHAQVVRQGIVTRSVLRRNRGGYARPYRLSPQARATCLNKRQAAANLGAGNPKVRRLYALCAQAGY